MGDIELANDHWLVAERISEIKKGWSSFLFIAIFFFSHPQKKNKKITIYQVEPGAGAHKNHH